MNDRKVQGPILDTFYARLKKCGDLSCSGKPFTEHHNVPDLRPSAEGSGPGWDDRKPSRWRGTNLLGFALMNVRDQL